MASPPTPPSARALTRVGTVALASLAMLVVLASGALAHVTVEADNPAPGAFTKYTVRVPNESDTAATAAIEVQFPDGFEPDLVKPVAAWDITIADGVLTVEAGRIPPGQFQEFEFTARNPETATVLTFPVVQTYDDGEEARWVGEPGTDSPAPQVEIVASGPEDVQSATSAPAAAPTEATDDAGSDHDAGPGGLTIVALAVAAVALAVSGAALASARRR